MESVRNNLPLISLCLLIIGTINLLVYYDYFDINILSYLDLTEVFQLQFRFFVVSVLYLVGLLLYTLLTPGSSAPHPGEIAVLVEIELKKKLANASASISPNAKPDEINKEAIIKKIQKRMKEREVPITAFVTLVLFLIIAKWWGYVRGEHYLIVHVLMWLEFILFVILLYFVFKQIQNNFIAEHFGETSGADASRKVIVINVLLALAFAASIRAREEAMDVLTSPSYFQITAQLEDTTLVTNINYRFIGKTKNNIFFYDLKKHQAEVYSSDNMKSFIVKDLRKVQASESKQQSPIIPTSTAPETKPQVSAGVTPGPGIGREGR